MLIDGKEYRSIWVKPGDRQTIQVIDQCTLPHHFEVMDLSSVDDCCNAISDMHVRGAGLIGATAAYGMYLAAVAAEPGKLESIVDNAEKRLIATRPTAANLAWAVARVREEMERQTSTARKVQAAFEAAAEIVEEDVENSRLIGQFGLEIIRDIARCKGGEPVQILTHCNAGCLAFVDHGTATAPIYAAHKAGIDLHVWVDETRPRNQGAALTAWELGMSGVPHDLVVDNAGGHLMQHGMVDMIIVGADRVTRRGDAANKIGSYLKALAAYDNGIPFYVALPSSTFDFTMADGLAEIPIEERDPSEVTHIRGLQSSGEPMNMRICPQGTSARNYGFDVTPARLITKLICERGICDATEAAIRELFPDVVASPDGCQSLKEDRLSVSE